MIKKIGFATLGAAAGMVMLSGFASAEGTHAGGFPGASGDDNQVGLVNANNVDVLHNVNVNVGVCDNTIGVGAVQVPVDHALNGLGLNLLSSGTNTGASAAPESCAANENTDGGTFQSK
ncbi:hypothetical protein [Actinophytocola oryzae]|uniref:Small secreted domain DUF320 n=1 Tax=Actinophytocola oryzae TaxID=502181 RepID=A0A4R7VQ93_9PSEU|nr:hypothetical protein [Actinophytocola oryzae]TDV51910.1 hypothetical protein CLV71_10539 [Actinophytocola oryzae]